MLIAGVSIILAIWCASALGQTYPAKPVRVLVGFPAGAGVDITMRLVTAKLSESMGRAFLVDNRPGAAGNISVEVAARAAPDGYTLLGMTAAAAVSQSAYSKVPVNLARDITPIALIASAPFYIAVHPSVPARSLKGLIALAKTKPRQLSYSTPGTASSPHLAMELLETETGIDLLHVPYKGTVPAIADTIAGNVSMTIANALTALPAIKSGRLRPIAVTSLKRSASAPEIPTVAESGIKGFDAGTWYALAAPAGVPGDIVTRLNRAVVEVVQLPDIREKLLAQGAAPLTATPDEAREFVRNEIARWARVVKAAGIRLD
ncbi:MAG TPA: tripartite tricarboxylate transporter substrate binding protein [Burkholderiales bacterium]|nr:tripartite tricarboxylate transporter substrate binding protein [Burkholderiales bacterium]